MRCFPIALIFVFGCTNEVVTFTSDLAHHPDMTIVFPSDCADGMLDDDETDVDCGGSCSPCGAGQICKHGHDCQSASCTNLLCDPPSCTDGTTDQDETDVDCGGATCAGCADGKVCNVAGDCKSGTCSNSRCKASPCSNGAMDGAETDVDCGGGTCEPCNDGRKCNLGTDCVSTVCTNNVCKGTGNCMDGRKDGSESDVDCGGGTCPQCDLGQACRAAQDCANGICNQGICSDPNAFTCGAALMCASFCDENDPQCADNCYNKITTRNGNQLIKELLDCDDTQCNFGNGSPCDPNRQDYPGSCFACYTGAEQAGQPCHTELVACNMDQ